MTTTNATLAGFPRYEPDPDHSRIECPCGVGFVWPTREGVTSPRGDMDVKDFIETHTPHLDAKLSSGIKTSNPFVVGLAPPFRVTLPEPTGLHHVVDVDGVQVAKCPSEELACYVAESLTEQAKHWSGAQ